MALAAGCLVSIALGAGTAAAQVSPSTYDYARPELTWYTIETEHFLVHFHADEEGRGSSRTAQVVARIAEEIYPAITGLYDHEPDTKVSFVLKDYEDYSNGAAYFFDNKIEIWAPALDSPLRGDHRWLRNVITHEFTHIVQVQKTMKAGRKLPFLYLQVLDYEDVRRPDVLYGYPNVIVTYPIPTLNNPAWLAEGTAQYQRAGLHYDRWDTHRDMLLRTRVLAGKELSLADMGGFYSHSSLLREGVYNHGFAFTHYLANTYGEEALRRLSAALGTWSNWNVERAMRDALGVPGDRVYADWMGHLRQAYRERTEAVRASLAEGDLVEPDGFYNFYPRFSPDGTRLAYLSNRGEDFSRTSLYVRDLTEGTVTAHHLDGLDPHVYVHTCALGHRLRSGVAGAFDWRPDGQAIVYARRRDTPEGYLYADLYEIDLASKSVERLTTKARATDPAYAPDGAQIVFIRQEDGTTNLVRLDRATGAMTPLTDFQDGTQVSDPVWHPSGDWIYLARTQPDGHGRDLYRLRPDGSDLQPVLATPADERSPAFDPDGQALYYSSDASGIFNLYRLPLPAGEALPDPSRAERLTNVLGGAFMPDVDATGRLAFAQYQWDGYKIAWREIAPLPEAARTASYTPPPITQKPDVPAPVAAEWAALNRYDDADLRPWPAPVLTAVRTEGTYRPPSGTDAPATTSAEPVAETAPEPAGSSVRPYSQTFTSFSFFPVLRLDQYVTRRTRDLDARLTTRTRGEALLRNLKTGVYVSSREVLEGMSLLGGVLVGPASKEATSLGDFFSPSRLLDLERDAFLQVEYRKGFGFLPRRWSPQLAVELYNIRRNVDRGLTIEEFPCTACYPDTTYADLAYSLWEADVFARSKVNRYTLLEVGYRYSPYRVKTERFFSREEDQFIPSSSSRYYIGRAFMANAYVELLRPYRDADVLPEGLCLEARYEAETGRLLERFDVENGVLVPQYRQDTNHRLTLDTRFGLRLPGRPGGGVHGLGLRLRGSTLLGPPVDDFYNDYVGGLIGARGYPFYALGGNETLWLQAAYHAPLLPRIHRQVLFVYLDKLYARLYADAAMAWSGPWPGLDAARRDVGAELRLGVGSFYLLPTALFLSATYGLDRFDFRLDEGFLTPDGRSTVRYGREWQWHFGVLFGFDV